MVPFDMTKFDGGKFADKDCKSITERIIDVAKVLKLLRNEIYVEKVSLEINPYF